MGNSHQAGGKQSYVSISKPVKILTATQLRVGSSVVQFARSRRDMKEYAVKFFLDTDAFETEATLFAAHMPALRASLAWPLAARAASIAADAVAAAAAPRSGGSAATTPAAAQPARSGTTDQFLPDVAAVSDGTMSALEGPLGCVGLPPFVVTARGESLLEWSNRAAPDIFAALSVRLPSFHFTTLLR